MDDMGIGVGNWLVGIFGRRSWQTDLADHLGVKVQTVNGFVKRGGFSGKHTAALAEWMTHRLRSVETDHPLRGTTITEDDVIRAMSENEFRTAIGTSEIRADAALIRAARKEAKEQGIDFPPPPSRRPRRSSRSRPSAPESLPEDDDASQR